MKVLDLFSGIGGFSLGLERAGMETVAFCEIEEFPRKVLKKHWPDVTIYDDVRQLNAARLVSDGITGIDVICGGFPCQPFSTAGKRDGEEDDRHLWPEYFRLIQEIHPAWVIGENVAGLINLGLDKVLFDLESEGYTAESFVIPACAVNAIHRRDRVWIVAHSESSEWWRGEIRGAERNGRPELHGKKGNASHAKKLQRNGNKHDSKNRRSQTSKFGGGNSRSATNSTRQLSYRAGTEPEKARGDEPTNCCKAIAYSNNDRSQRQSDSGKGNGKQSWGEATGANYQRNEFRHIPIPTESSVCARDDGVSNRVARLKALGNAVVPQIPEIIGGSIMEIESCQT